MDNIFVNVDHLQTESGIILSDISDHCPVYCKIQSLFNLAKSPPSSKIVRKFTTSKIDKLKGKLGSIDWAEVLAHIDVNVSYNNFIHVLKIALDECIPLERCKFSSYRHEPRNPWVSKSLLRSINRKNNLYYKFRANPKPKLREKYVKYKNTLTKIMRLEKQRYYCSQFEKKKSNIKETWGVINKALNKKSGKKSIKQIREDNKTINDEESIANHFNDYFSNIGPNLAKKIPVVGKPFHSFLKNKNQNSIFFSPTNSSEILKLVKNFKEKRRVGHDEVSNFLLINIIHEIVVPLEHIFNLSMSQGAVPDAMKLAKVVPIFKKGDPLDSCNYRPISLLSSISKVLEKLIYDRTVAFLVSNNIFSDSQFGFRQKHSTVHAILHFINHVTSAIDEHSHNLGMFLDLSKAFDTIDHQILLYKLSHYGIRERALEWFESYLRGRKQYVSINGADSAFQQLICGVPQGCVPSV